MAAVATTLPGYVQNLYTLESELPEALLHVQWTTPEEASPSNCCPWSPDHMPRIVHNQLLSENQDCTQCLVTRPQRIASEQLPPSDIRVVETMEVSSERNTRTIAPSIIMKYRELKRKLQEVRTYEGRMRIMRETREKDPELLPKLKVAIEYVKMRYPHLRTSVDSQKSTSKDLIKRNPVEASSSNAVASTSRNSSTFQDKIVKDAEHVTAKSASPEADRSSECIVCMDQPTNCVFVSCGHLVTCMTCAEKIKKRGNKLCPICRRKITKALRVYTR